MKYWLMLFMMAALAGCSGQQDDDIDQFIKGSGSKMKGKVDPLPEVKQFVPYVFNAAGELSDPFTLRKTVTDTGKGKQDKLKPDLQRLKEALEGFPLENLKYVGTLKKGNQATALINAPDGQVYQVRVGNYMGQNFGMVTKIIADEVLVKEVVQDVSGDWVERQVPIYPQEDK